MMDDHYQISAARNELLDALKTLLNPEIMGPDDFRRSRGHASAAIERLDDLLRLADRHAPKP